VADFKKMRVYDRLQLEMKLIIFAAENKQTDYEKIIVKMLFHENNCL